MLRGHSQHWYNSRDKLCKSMFEGRICEEVNKELESVRMPMALPALPGNVIQRKALTKPGLSSGFKRSSKEVNFLAEIKGKDYSQKHFYP